MTTSKRSRRDLNKELDMPIPWISALIIVLMALLAAVAYCDEPSLENAETRTSVYAQREKLELGRQYLITEFADAVDTGTVTQEQATTTAQEIIRIDLAILQSYIAEGGKSDEIK